MFLIYIKIEFFELDFTFFSIFEYLRTFSFTFFFKSFIPFSIFYSLHAIYKRNEKEKKCCTKETKE